MQPDALRRRLEAIPTLSLEGKRINGLYRLMLSDRLLWQQAYISLAPNQGAVTPGVDARNTLDGYSPQRVERIIVALADGSYRFSPARRVNIPKAKGGTRPLGIPTGDDKLVQEVARQLLNLVYEPVFSDRAHGFRAGRSCHTALHEMQRTWSGVKWMIDIDVRGFFNNIDHKILVGLLEKKIDDKRFIKLIKGMLAAGYVEDWRFHRTFSGTPQGGVISPVLANVYLHELDMFVHGLATAFDRGGRRSANVEYQRYSNRIYSRRKAVDRLAVTDDSTGEVDSLLAEIARLEAERSRLPSSDEFDPGYRRLRYCRYADDFVLGVIGSRQDATDLKQQMETYLHEQLRLDVSVEKSGIHHADKGVVFLGYRVRRWGTHGGSRIAKRTKRASRHITVSSPVHTIQLSVPEEVPYAFAKRKKYGDLERLQSHQRAWMASLSDTEIVAAYNAEMRGLANYYCLAYDVKTALNKLHYLWWGSMLRTLALKHKTTVTKVANHLRTPDGEHVVHYVVGDKRHMVTAFKMKHMTTTRPDAATSVDVEASLAIWINRRSELVERLNARVCEACGATDRRVEIHHVRRLADVKNEHLIVKLKAARTRKRFVLCVQCHHDLHAGRLTSRIKRA
jgi:group II intron reverse transcriptase/maturase